MADGEQQRLEIRIARDGTISAETHGIKGKACMKYIAALEDMLEAQTVRSSYTDEYYETTSVTEASPTRNDLQADA